MLICDMHCDLPSQIMEGFKIKSNKAHFAEDKLKKDNVYVQVFANFVDKLSYDDPFGRVNSLIHCFKEELKNSEIGLVTKYDELSSNIKNKKNSAILSIEGGEALGGKIENVEYFYNLGVRFLTLTWNNRNQLGTSSHPSCSDEPLTEFGKQVIREMNRLKMTPDVSHLSEKGFWSVIKESKMPIVATHSNAKKLCGHNRNLTDEQFLAIKKSGGLVGINFYPGFLADDETKADIKSIISHIEHFMALGGKDTLALGGDLDGIPCLPKGMNSVSDIDKIAEELAKINYREDTIKKIMGENFINHLKLILD